MRTDAGAEGQVPGTGFGLNGESLSLDVGRDIECWEICVFNKGIIFLSCLSGFRKALSHCLDTTSLSAEEDKGVFVAASWSLRKSASWRSVYTDLKR